MKKVFILVGMLIFALATITQAKKLPTVAAKLPANLKDVITKNLEYPREAQNKYIEGDVWLKLCVTDDSKIKVVDISATNQDLGDYVKKELSSVYVNNPGCKAGQVYYLKVKFDLLSNK